MKPPVFSCLASRVTNNGSLYGRFLFGPLPIDISVTLATILRRSLLHSKSTFAIVSAEIEGANHEYASLPGVQESVLEILLNLAEIVLTGKERNLLDPSLKSSLKYQIPPQRAFAKHAEGPETVGLSPIGARADASQQSVGLALGPSGHSEHKACIATRAPSGPKGQGQGQSPSPTPRSNFFSAFLRISGPCVVTAKDVNWPNGIYCVKPNAYIATLSNNATLALRLKIRFFPKKQSRYDFSDEPSTGAFSPAPRGLGYKPTPESLTLKPASRGAVGSLALGLGVLGSVGEGSQRGKAHGEGPHPEGLAPKVQKAESPSASYSSLAPSGRVSGALTVSGASQRDKKEGFRPSVSQPAPQGVGLKALSKGPEPKAAVDLWSKPSAALRTEQGFRPKPLTQEQRLWSAKGYDSLLGPRLTDQSTYNWQKNFKSVTESFGTISQHLLPNYRLQDLSGFSAYISTGNTQIKLKRKSSLVVEGFLRSTSKANILASGVCGLLRSTPKASARALWASARQAASHASGLGQRPTDDPMGVLRSTPKAWAFGPKNNVHSGGLGLRPVSGVWALPLALRATRDTRRATQHVPLLAPLGHGKGKAQAQSRSMPSQHSKPSAPSGPKGQGQRQDPRLRPFTTPPSIPFEPRQRPLSVLKSWEPAEGSRELTLSSSVYPVEKVNFLIQRDDGPEGYRHRIIFEVWTNGSISPRQAIFDSIRWIIKLIYNFREPARLS